MSQHELLSSKLEEALEECADTIESSVPNGKPDFAIALVGEYSEMDNGYVGRGLESAGEWDGPRLWVYGQNQYSELREYKYVLV